VCPHEDLEAQIAGQFREVAVNLDEASSSGRIRGSFETAEAPQTAAMRQFRSGFGEEILREDGGAREIWDCEIKIEEFSQEGGRSDREF
jgi:hypothetical protein